jgi:hypothetical protein
MHSLGLNGRVVGPANASQNEYHCMSLPKIPSDADCLRLKFLNHLLFGLRFLFILMLLLPNLLHICLLLCLLIPFTLPFRGQIQSFRPTCDYFLRISCYPHLDHLLFYCSFSLS